MFTPLPEVKPFNEQQEDYAKRLDLLEELAEQIEQAKDLSLTTALEADKIIPDINILDCYFSPDEGVATYQKALEEVSAGAVAIVAAAIAAVAALIYKLIQFIRGKLNTPNHFVGNAEQVKAVEDVLRDHELKSALSEAEDILKHVPKDAMEDMRPQGYVNVSVTEVFDSFKRSLNESEVDFLTSGHRYKVIKDVVEDFSRGKYPDFVYGIGDDIDRWIKDGLDKAPHIGRDSDVVNTFIREQKRQYETIKSDYRQNFSGIRDMVQRCMDHVAKGSIEHLHMFQKKPSALFPHLEHLWRSIRFENISHEDKRLLSSLERVKKQFDEMARKMEGRSEHSRGWAAEDAMLRLAQSSTREMAEYISNLVRVGNFIRNSSEAAYHATVKSFSYITRLLNAISKIPDVDRDRLKKCLDVITQKRNALTGIIQMA